jgi:hypothetical protein
MNIIKCYAIAAALLASQCHAGSRAATNMLQITPASSGIASYTPWLTENRDPELAQLALRCGDAIPQPETP